VQQLTGPVMAKALEDTAFYRYHRLLALNEVGGDPALPAITAGEFHRRMRARTTFPQAMTATATHDTKRGEDARTRILAIAELADDWSAAVHKWQALNEPLVRRSSGRAPTVEHEYMLYQALIGAWPATGPDAGFIERMQGYAVKALREGKQESSWHNPNEAYETATTTFIARLLDRESSAAFLQDFEQFTRRTDLIGALNSLTQVTLKATIPGIPDFYQGTEFWDLSLVDPDNRRPVDFDARRIALQALAASPDWNELAEKYPDGLIKLALTRRLLAMRSAMRELFTTGNYEPIEVEGPQARHVIAFARTLRRDAVIVAVMRHFAPLTDSGRRWLQTGDIDAVLKLDGYVISENYLGPGASSLQGPVHASAVFGVLPVALIRAIRRR
jgi:(1->4)-alpha-D-glucan 1-alpha-D-glucosylmutase